MTTPAQEPVAYPDDASPAWAVLRILNDKKYGRPWSWSDDRAEAIERLFHPTPAPLGEQERAVVEAAVALHARRAQARDLGVTALTQNFGPLYAAVDRLIAHRAGRPA